MGKPQHPSCEDRGGFGFRCGHFGRVSGFGQCRRRDGHDVFADLQFLNGETPGRVQIRRRADPVLREERHLALGHGFSLKGNFPRDFLRRFLIGTSERRDIDVICLVRGGGSPLDLASFDRDEIGHAIAQCRKPVWMGIGHEIDVTVPDFVAHTSHKTPTAVAAALVERLQDLDVCLKSTKDRLADS